jgi:hypothetical protein
VVVETAFQHNDLDDAAVLHNRMARSLKFEG